MSPNDLDQIAAELRNGVRQGDRISDLLQRHAERHCLGTIQLIQCLRSAFGLSLRQASPVGGWLPDGSGEITHERLDQLIGEAIESPPTFQKE